MRWVPPLLVGCLEHDLNGYEQAAHAAPMTPAENGLRCSHTDMHHGLMASSGLTQHVGMHALTWGNPSSYTSLQAGGCHGHSTACRWSKKMTTASRREVRWLADLT